jgi:hypothetical protein
MESQVLDPVEKPFIDEEAFQQLLEAAYVLQQQNDFERLQQRLAPSPPTLRANPEKTLAIIAETQHVLRTQRHDQTAAANLIAERLQKIIQAEGVAIALAHDGRMEYCAALGSASTLAGTSIAIPGESSDVPAVSDANAGTSWNAALAGNQPTGENNSIVLPLRSDGKIAGFLEVRFKSSDAIDQQEVHICHLMAGLMIEALARSADLEWKQTLAAERATMFEALEMIQPQLERLAAGTPEASAPNPIETASSEDSAAASKASPTETIPRKVRETSVPPVRVDFCVCGYKFGVAERFCGKCGKPRPSNSASFKGAAGTNGQGKLENLGDPSRFAADAHADEADEPVTLPPADDEFDSATQPSALAVRAVKYEIDSPWSSSRKTRLWLESLQTHGPARRWMDRHRANVYVWVAVALLLIAIWGIHSPTPAPSKNPQPSLGLLDEILVDLGVAEPPPGPVSTGNPSAKVWVDMHTALYYCPGSDLYGKTPGGKYTTQRDAQMDQFQPAGQRTCN